MSNHSALVIGAGVAGLQAAIDLANMGVHVHLVEKEPRLGGHVPLLHKVFPTQENPEELVKQILEKIPNNPNITVVPYSEIESVQG
ncbi:FAD-dependent oxidoreductase, partial [Candidatus Bathyarchaeota archaeon]|nr:FAD-dependent oxidoreductase [Candidatus Bathyarchaeota archaeon]